MCKEYIQMPQYLHPVNICKQAVQNQNGGVLPSFLWFFAPAILSVFVDFPTDVFLAWKP
jgi:hypothetical protein